MEMMRGTAALLGMLWMRRMSRGAWKERKDTAVRIALLQRLALVRLVTLA